MPNEIAASENPAELRKQQLLELFPEAFTEGRLDVAALKRALGESAVIESGERYALNWAGKRDAYKVLQTPTTATVRPQRDLSVNFDAAQHVFIEGENLEVLKVLQKAYFGKVKLIYIDPPYNTGSDSFIYPDRFQESKDEYLKRINELSDDGTLMREGFFRKNNKENGQFHSNWLSMMLPRLYIARNLLREDGVIFVSCDDNEVHNLRLVMNEVFGEENWIATLVWHNSSRHSDLIAIEHEYVHVFGRSQVVTEKSWKRERSITTELYNIVNKIRADNGTIENALATLGIKIDALLEEDEQRGDGRYTWLSNYKNIDEDWHIYYPVDLSGEGSGPPRKFGDQIVPAPPGRHWMSQEYIDELYADKRIAWRGDRAYRKLYIEESDENLKSIIKIPTRNGSETIKQLLGKDAFDKPKPHNFLQLFVKFTTEKNDIVMDFFAGAASFAHAVIEQNIEDNQQRQYICIQLPEEIDEDNPAAKMGFKTIADVARARVRRVVEINQIEPKLSTNAPANLGFKSFLLAPSNFKQWRGDGIETPEQLAEQMQMFVPMEKDGAQPEDMLYELLLKFGQELTTPIETLDVNGGRVFALHERQMLFVLETFTEPMIDALVALKPREIIAIDSVFHDSDELKTNLDLQCHDAGIRFTCL